MKSEIIFENSLNPDPFYGRCFKFVGNGDGTFFVLAISKNEGTIIYSENPARPVGVNNLKFTPFNGKDWVPWFGEIKLTF